MSYGETLDTLRGHINWQSGIQNQSADTVRLHFTHSNLKAEFPEIRLSLHTNIAEMRIKMANHCGSSSSSMVMYLKDSAGNTLCTLDDDSKMLGYYSPMDGFLVHIVDTDEYSLSAGGGLEDVTLVKKYEISEEAYDKLDVSFRKFKADKLKEDPTWTIKKEMKRRKDPMWEPTADDFQQELAEKLGAVGSRCECKPGGRRGELKYVGQCPELAPGFWVGVQFDEPLGKNGGKIKGTRYFECEEGFGSMLRPELVETGDFPEEDPFASSDEDEDEI